MYVDFKITTWERCELPSDLTPEQVKSLEDKIKSGVITNYDELKEECGITSHENGGCTTIEFYNDKNGGCTTIEFYNDKNEPSAINTNE